MGDKQIKGNRNGTFSSSLGFVIACVGSAVGLGNIWMFPYRVGQYGGAAFLIPYLLFTFLFGWVGLSGEFAIGRLARTGTIGSYEYCFARRGRKKLGAALSWIPLLGSLGIAIGYAVILGWVLRSLAGSVTGELLTADVEAFFHQASGSFGSVPWHVAIVVLVGLVLMFGVTKGIEKVSKVLMPLFFGLFLILGGVGRIPAWRGRGLQISLCSGMEGAAAGGYLGDGDGASVFSLSITGSGMIVYGAYLGKEADIPRASLRTALFDTLAALLSGLAIMPPYSPMAWMSPVGRR